MSLLAHYILVAGEEKTKKKKEAHSITLVVKIRKKTTMAECANYNK